MLIMAEIIFIFSHTPEIYLKEMSAMFQHTIEIHWHDNPVISTQAMILGSNKIDFMNPHFKEHSIKTLYLEPLEAKDPFELYHNYRRNESSVQFCKGGGGMLKKTSCSRRAVPEF